MQRDNSVAPDLSSQSTGPGSRRVTTVAVLCLAGLILVPALLQAYLPAESRFRSALAAVCCPFREATGLHCPLCELTTSGALTLCGDFSAAWRTHLLGPPAVLFSLWLLGYTLVAALRKRPLLPAWLLTRTAAGLLIAVVLVVWVIHLLALTSAK